MNNRPKLIRLTTTDISLDTLLRGQLKFLNGYFEVVGVADDSGLLAEVAAREGIRTIAVPMRREISLAADLKSLFALIKLFRRERPHIVHANTPKGSLLAMTAAFATRVPHRIYTVTGLRFETTHGLFRLLLKTMERIACACATKVIPEGDGVKNTLYREGITRKPLQKILNGNISGIDTEYFSRTQEVAAQAAELKEPDTFTFIFIGRMVRDKGINELIAAFDRLSKQDERVRLILAGKFEDDLDPAAPETEKIINTNPHIRFVGYQSDVRPYLAASDVLVLPSYREGFPNVVIQAGALGLPCIVTDISGSNEIIEHGVNGIIIPKQDTDALYEAMRRLAENRAETSAMAAVARDMTVSRYRQQDVWNAILEMYKSLE